MGPKCANGELSVGCAAGESPSARSEEVVGEEHRVFGLREFLVENRVPERKRHVRFVLGQHVLKPGTKTSLSHVR